jgi:hypothetical protein
MDSKRDDGRRHHMLEAGWHRRSMRGSKMKWLMSFAMLALATLATPASARPITFYRCGNAVVMTGDGEIINLTTEKKVRSRFFWVDWRSGNARYKGQRCTEIPRDEEGGVPEIGKLDALPSPLPYE